MASGNASTSVLDLCSLSASASRETLRSLKGAVACPEVPTILNSFAMFQIRECQRTICGAPNYKSRATSILNLDLNIRAGCPSVKSTHSSQATLVYPRFCRHNPRCWNVDGPSGNYSGATSRLAGSDRIARMTGNRDVVQHALNILGPIRVRYQFLRVAYNAKGGCQCRDSSKLSSFSQKNRGLPCSASRDLHTQKI